MHTYTQRKRKKGGRGEANGKYQRGILRQITSFLHMTCNWVYVTYTSLDLHETRCLPKLTLERKRSAQLGHLRDGPMPWTRCTCTFKLSTREKAWSQKSQGIKQTDLQLAWCRLKVHARVKVFWQRSHFRPASVRETSPALFWAPTLKPSSRLAQNASLEISDSAMSRGVFIFSEALGRRDW